MEAGLTGLVQALREARFSVGPAESIAAARLVARLQRHPAAPVDAAALRLWLRPVLCSNREEQSRFDELFAQWVHEMAQRRPQPTADRDSTDPALPAPAPSAWRRWWAQLRGAAPGLLVLAAVVAALFFAWQRRDTTPAAAPPASAAAPQPAPETALLPKNVAPDSNAAARPAPPAPLGPGFAPAWREARTLRPEVVLPLLLTPLLLAWLLGGAPPLALLRGQRRSPRSVALDTRRLEAQARALLPPLEPGVAGRLQRHLRADSAAGAPLARRRRIDEQRTIEALLRRPGDLRLRYRPAPLRPSYLVLVDAQDQNDPRGRLFVHWAERLRREGLDVQVRTFRHANRADDAPLSQALQGRVSDTPLALDRLPDPPAGQRLVVVGETAAWAEPDGAWRAWYRRARLHRWRERAFFTPTELRDWGDREGAIEEPEHAADPGFLMLPMDDSALEAWSVFVASGWLPPFSMSEPQRYPRLLVREGFDAFAVPAADERERLVAQLMLYLGDTGFRWLCMLAVPPLVRWELTLLLGQTLLAGAAGVEATPLALGRAYRRLTRLPWLRGQPQPGGGVQAPGLPDWLRLRLLDELPPAAADDVRQRVDTLLSTLHEGPGTLELGFEAPPQRGIGASGRSPDAPGDALYLGILTGMTPRQLAQRVPDAWRAWLRPRPPARGGGWRGQAALARDWLHARWGLMAFRDGLPWAGRNPAAGVLAVVVTALAVGALWRTAALPPQAVSPVLEAALFRHRVLPVEVPLARGARAGALSPDGLSAALLGADGRIHIADATSGRVLRSFGEAAFADHLTFDGQRVAACASGDAPDDAARRVRAWRATGEPQEATPRTDCLALPMATRRDPLGALLRATDDLYPADRPLTSAANATPSLAAAAYDRRGTLVATADLAGAVTLSRVATPRGGDAAATADGRLFLGPSPVRTLSLSDDGSRLLSVQVDGRVRVSEAWQTPLGQSAAPVVAAAVSGDGRTVATLGADGRLVVQHEGAQTWSAVEYRATGWDGRLLLAIGAVRLGGNSVELALNGDGTEVAFRAPGGAWTGTTGGSAGQLSQLPRLPNTEAVAVAYLSDGRLRVVHSGGAIVDWMRGRPVTVRSSAPEGPLPTNAIVHASGLVVAFSLGVTRGGQQQSTVSWRSDDGLEGGDRSMLIDADSLAIGSMGRSLWWMTQTGDATGLRIGADAAPRRPWQGDGEYRVAAFDDRRSRFARIDPQGRLDFIDLGGSEADGPAGRETGVTSVQALPDKRWLVVHDDGVVRIEDEQSRGRTWPAMRLAGAPGTVHVAANGRAVVATSVVRPQLVTASVAPPDAMIAPVQQPASPPQSAAAAKRADALRQKQAGAPRAAPPAAPTRVQTPVQAPVQAPVADQPVPERAGWWALPAAPAAPIDAARSAAVPLFAWLALLLVVAGAAAYGALRARRWRLRMVTAMLGGAAAVAAAGSAA